MKQTSRVTVKNMPEPERPYEKCLKSGTGVLSNAELLSVILRTGTKGERIMDISSRILELSGDGSGLVSLNHLTVSDLKKVKGIGDVKAIQIQCVCELSRRIWKATRETGFPIRSPKDAADYYMEDLRHKEQEESILVMMDGKNNFLGDMRLSTGTVNASLVSTREIFKTAVRQNAVYIILIHNHPSGDPTPSSNDISVTKKICEAGKLMDIELIDHLIIGDKRYISLKEKGYI